MRSGTSNAAPPDVRSKHDHTPTTASDMAPSPAVSYFLADEKSMEESLTKQDARRASPTRRSVKPRLKDSSYGVQSLTEDETEDETEDLKIGDSMRHHGEETHRVESTPPNVPSMLSRPMTPISITSPAPGSLASSPRSTSTKSLYHPSDVDDSHAVSSDEEANDEEGPADDMFQQDNSLQLIMPSINMPARRPFTERGKVMGRFKVLIAGRQGCGKTSFLKSLFQSCEDIVHIDPLTPTTPKLQRPVARRSRSAFHASAAHRTKQITEIHASTKAYPAWWSTLENSRVLRRQRKGEDTVLERNLCFVDTPGYGGNVPFLDLVEDVSHYIERQMERTASTMSNVTGDSLGLLSGHGGSHVDAVFYLVSEKPTPEDLEYLRRLCPLTNVIPVISRPSLSSQSSTPSISSLKTTLLQEFQRVRIQPFLFGRRLDELINTSNASSSAPFVILADYPHSSTSIDSSLLMGHDYIQSSVHSELQALVDQVIEPSTIAWLRHAAATKLLRWHEERLSGATSSIASTRLSATHRTPPPPPAVLKRNDTSPPFYGGQGFSGSSRTAIDADSVSSYALARVADHSQREERFAQVRLAQWAVDLQRSLDRERQRYEALARGEQAHWLKGRVDESLMDGSLTLSAMEESVILARRRIQPRSPSPDQSRLVSTYKQHNRETKFYSPDPLGILDITDTLYQYGWTAIKVVGSVGIIGGFAVWVARSYLARDGLS